MDQYAERKCDYFLKAHINNKSGYTLVQSRFYYLTVF